MTYIRTMEPSEELTKLANSFIELNKYDSGLNQSDVINWMDAHFDEPRQLDSDLALHGIIHLKDDDGKKFRMYVYRANDDSKQIAFTADDDDVIHLKEEDAEGLFDGVFTWATLRYEERQQRSDC